jgi:hypothetical protein
MKPNLLNRMGGQLKTEAVPFPRKAIAGTVVDVTFTYDCAEKE